MDIARDSELPADLSPLAWVQEELRRSLEAVHKTLRRLLRDGENRQTAAAGLGVEGQAAASVNASAQTALQAAAAQLHQVAGVLGLVGLPAGSLVLRAAEQAVATLAEAPAKIDLARVETIERADFALLSLIARMLAGGSTASPLPSQTASPVSTLSLFPAYRDLQAMNGAERIHPADLWQFEWSWRHLPPDARVQALPAATVRPAFEAALLKHMRAPSAEHARSLSELSAGLAMGLDAPRSKTLWQLAAAMFEAQALGLLEVDALVKRLGSRLLSQMRAVAQGDAGVNERLAQDLLFFCAQSSTLALAQSAPRLQAALASYGLLDVAAGDYEDQTLGHIDPAWVTQARRRVVSAKDSWGSAAEGDSQRANALNEQFVALAESLQKLFPSGEVLAESLQRAVVATLRSEAPPPPALAMEVATSLLYVEAALDDAAFDQPEQAERVRRLAGRIESVARGGEPEPLEAWMEDLYRRVSDRQTLGSVVQELRVNLSEIERQADEYFRDPSQRERLIPVPGQLQAMRGVLTVLGLDQASLACLRMRDEVDELANTEVDVERGGPRELFDRLANNLGALGFLIDMLSVQPQLAKRMFVFDEASGRLNPVMGRRSGANQVPPLSPPPLLPAHDVVELGAAAAAAVVPVPAVPSVPAPVAAAAPVQADLPVLDFALELPPEQPVSRAPEPTLPALAVVQELPAPAAAAASAVPHDPEMQEIFLEEATEVLANARAALATLQEAPSEREALTVLRRAFHTLKGSARMVGMDAFGEGAWACEQLYNARLAEAVPTGDAALLSFTNEALDYLGAWCAQIAAQQPVSHLSEHLRHAADALRLGAAASPAVQVPATEWPATSVEIAPLDLAPAALESLELLDLRELPELQELEDLEHAETLLPDLAQVSGESAAPAEPADLDQEIAAEELPFELHLPSEALEQAAPVFELPEFELRLDLGEEIEQQLFVASTPLPLVPVEPVADAHIDAATEAEAEAEAEAEGTAEPIIARTPVRAAFEPVLVKGGRAVDEPPPETQVEPELLSEAGLLDESLDEQFKMIGNLPVKLELFNIFLNEADELSRRLATSLAEWALELNRPVPANCEALAHALSGSAAAVKFDDLATLTRAMEHALGRAGRASRYSEAEAQLFVGAADQVRQLLHQFAAGFLKTFDPDTLAQLRAYEPNLEPNSRFGELSDLEDDGKHWRDSRPGAASAALETVETLEALEFGTALTPSADADEVEPGLPDEIDPVLLPIFEEEARDLLRDLHAALREWVAKPSDLRCASACMRALHTLKGGARLTGAMRLGEQAHALESALERAVANGLPLPADLLGLQAGADALEVSFEQLGVAAPAPASLAVVPPVVEALAEPIVEPLVEPSAAPSTEPSVEAEAAPVSEAVAESLAELAAEAVAPALLVEAPASSPASPTQPVAGGPQIDWSRFTASPQDEGTEAAATGLQALVRVRGSLLERMAAQAGEVSIRRARLESELAQMKGSLLDLDDNLGRLRSQLRELELQAESQLGGQQELRQAKAGSADFDPLEFDRYTRFQELTRMMAESVGDVATVQRALQRNVQLGEDELAAQSRLTRELQDDLLRTRMVEFESLAERLHRVVRQAARDAGRQARLEIVGAQTELDRSVLERMAGAFEHLLRNSVSHGIEPAEARIAMGKDPIGTLRLTVSQEGNEVLLNFSDDGAGLNLERIRARGLHLGLLQEGKAGVLDEAALMQLIFTPGFSTAAQVTELSGRGVGMDVVRAEVSTLGGSIETSSVSGQGTAFKLRLPLTTALTQVVLLRCGEQVVAVPAGLMDSLQRVPTEQVEAAYASGTLQFGGEALPFYWLGGLLGLAGRGHGHGKNMSVVLVRSAQQRIALHIDEVLGNQEVVVKNLGPQLSRVPGLAGISLLASGEVALIYNPVALSTWYGVAAQQRLALLRQQLEPGAEVDQAIPVEAEHVLAPLVLVVDDSLTVRRVTQRLLEREGYRVQLAKDGLDAMECLAAEELPAMVLSDIEMPRMDGFDLVRNMRADPRLAGLPVVMITSRIAQKHRDYAEQLGVNHYLGKPYDEELLLSLIAGYTSSQFAAEHVPPQSI
ncbi:Hpt domain-containing protein [Paucibacter sp. B2R-40]|uniref:hybrid sensor histidine kinase/response regulator n=1 Tax=Paucibacter sp. B2R-40 TaxID=2893554 RepID=UPI0021E3F496|nr:Hpt domain-containing protein [Paucibacter sp. B2R-40]MCV2355250.1 Hpt domain-containing protein [Paucibacter sp. B2R-40]